MHVALEGLGSGLPDVGSRGALDTLAAQLSHWQSILPMIQQLVGSLGDLEEPDAEGIQQLFTRLAKGDGTNI